MDLLGISNRVVPHCKSLFQSLPNTCGEHWQNPGVVWLRGENDLVRCGSQPEKNITKTLKIVVLPVCQGTHVCCLRGRLFFLYKVSGDGSPECIPQSPTASRRAVAWL